MTSTADIAVTTINSILDPRLSQVIGSTPDSLKDAVMRSAMENDSKAGAKFIALSVYSATVKKSVAEELFINKEMEDLRVKITNTFVLKGKLNMTAMTLAGHCFTLAPLLSTVQYIIEFKKKIGGDNIWDADMTKGSASDEMKKIMTQKMKLHTKVKCFEFAQWFLMYTGIAGTKAKGKAKVTDFVPPQVPPAGVGLGGVTSSIGLTAQIPEEVLDEWLELTGKEEKDLTESITKHGADRTVRIMKREIDRAKGLETATTLGVGSASGGKIT